MAKDYSEINGRNKPAKAKLTNPIFDRLKAAKGEQPDWSRIDGQWLVSVVAALTQEDGAVRLGYSRDGGTYAVCIYSGGEHETAYIRTDEELMILFQSIVEVHNG